MRWLNSFSSRMYGGEETDAEFWLGLIDVGGPQSNGSPFARMLETIDINSEDSEVKLLN